MSTFKKTKPFHSAKAEFKKLSPRVLAKSARIPSYKLAFTDQDFLLREALRPVRLQLELMKPELIQQDEHIESTIVIFGSARIPDAKKAKSNLAAISKLLKAKPGNARLQRQAHMAKRMTEKAFYYEEARKLAALISKICQTNGVRRFVVVTGGGPGIMEAANRGAHEIGAKSIGHNVVLPGGAEQIPNPYISSELCFQFHYFAIRKMHFLIRARAAVFFPGGFGTLDELFETLTLVQTGKIKPMPLLLFGKEYWSRLINFEVLVEEGMISQQDLLLFQFVETAEEAWQKIASFYQLKNNQE
jgi:uncharacterized protein (TIGR00730 family)